MPVEIKELIIRAFIGEDQDDDEEEDPDKKDGEEDQSQRQGAQDAITIISNMLKQEKER
ncbi:MAG: DUF5908 family protein [Bacteroidia bacterium]